MPRAVPWWNGLGNLRRMPPRMGAWQPGRLRYGGGGPRGRPAWKATLRCVGEESMSYGRVSGELLPPEAQRALRARKHAYGSRKRVNISFNSLDRKSTRLNSSHR